MNSACIIIPFYGSWPSYFRLYLESCNNLGYIDVHFITDLPTPLGYPSNVYFHNTPFEQLKKSFEDKIGFEIALDTPFKFCDFRPAFGVFFEEIIKDYKFWGWGDIDVIYGNFPEIMPENKLEYFDVWSLRKYWLSGSFCLLKNNRRMLKLFTENNDFKKVFTSRQNFAFDECGKNYNALRKGIPIQKLDLPISNMTLFIRKAEKEGKIIGNFRDRIKESIVPNGHVLYKHGAIHDQSGQEFIAYHLITEKRNIYFYYPQKAFDSEEVYIKTTGFYTPVQFKFGKIIHLNRILRSVPRMILSYFTRAFNLKKWLI